MEVVQSPDRASLRRLRGEYERQQELTNNIATQYRQESELYIENLLASQGKGICSETFLHPNPDPICLHTRSAQTDAAFGIYQTSELKHIYHMAKGTSVNYFKEREDPWAHEERLLLCPVHQSRAVRNSLKGYEVDPDIVAEWEVIEVDGRLLTRVNGKDVTDIDLKSGYFSELYRYLKVETVMGIDSAKSKREFMKRFRRQTQVIQDLFPINGLPPAS